MSDAVASTPERTIVRLSGVAKRYGNTVAVKTLDLDIERGEFFTLLGPSGSGKTTTLRMIAGFERPSDGVVEIAGANVTHIAPYDRDINTIFQDYALFPHMTVAENLAYGLKAKRVPRGEIPGRVEQALATVQLADFAERNPAQLSGGQRQRVALARAIVNRPRVLLLDEPLGALDLKLRQEMQRELKRIQAEVNITFIYVTHDQEEALTMSDRIAVFNGGRIEQIGTAAALYDRPASEFVARFLGSSNFIERDGQRLMIRPEKMRLLAQGERVDEGEWQVEPVRRVDSEFVGMYWRHVVALADGQTLVVHQQNLPGFGIDAELRADAELAVAWHRNSVCCFEVGAEVGQT